MGGKKINKNTAKQNRENKVQVYHASPNGSSGFAQLRLCSENAINEAAGDTDGAEGDLEHAQHDHVPLVKDEISVPIHSAPIAAQSPEHRPGGEDGSS